jgi:cytochrome P450 family 135
MPNALQALVWGVRGLPMLERCRERYGDVFSLYVGLGMTWVILSDPEDAKRVFTGEPSTLRGGAANAPQEPVMGPRSIVMLEEPEHMTRRRLMLPALHGDRLGGYEQMMREVTHKSIARWPLGEPFALLPKIREITLETIVRTVFGIDEPAQVASMCAVVTNAIEWANNPRVIVRLAVIGTERAKRLRSFRRMMDPMNAALLTLIRERRQAPDLAERNDILSVLLQARFEDGSAMSDQEVRDDMVSLVVAGYRTTATGLAWAFERLMRHRDKYERLREEVLSGSEDSYLDAVIKETLRLRPSPLTTLRSLAEPIELGGFTLPAGALAAPCSYLMHRRADIYPEPHSFLPERFLESAAGTYTWVPFGGGLRRCVGATFANMEMKQVIRTVLGEVDLRAPKSRSERISKVGIALLPKDGALAVAAARAGA